MRRTSPAPHVHPAAGRAARALRLAAVAAGLATCALGAAGSAGPLQGGLLVGYGSNIATAQPVPGAAHAAPGTRHRRRHNAAATGSFSISGKVTGLYPGKTLSLVLSVKNPQTFSITVTSITTAVSNASSTCLAANVTVTAFSGSLVVGAGKTGKVTVKATMAHSAPNACQGAFFPFHYTGTAS